MNTIDDNEIIGFSLYDPATKIVVSSGHCQRGDLDKQARDGFSVVPIRIDRRTQKLAFDDAGNPVAIIHRAAPLSVAQVKARAKAALALRRWEIETGGTDFNGQRIPTDDRAKVMIGGLAIRAQTNPKFTTTWKTPDGVWHPLDAGAVLAIYGAQSDWVAAAFKREAELAALIDIETTLDALIDLQPALEKFWP